MISVFTTFTERSAQNPNRGATDDVAFRFAWQLTMHMRRDVDGMTAASSPYGRFDVVVEKARILEAHHGVAFD